jgi:hypothetical protein
MAESDSIKRVRDDPYGLDFEVLKKEGLSLAQSLSGGTWTDYNAHDPGVTILDQLCFGLTELAYRSGFEIPDYLAAENGSIDFDALALFKPEAILPSHPVTLIDYAKLLFVAHADIDDVRLTVTRDADGNAQGLYDIAIRLYEPLGKVERTEEHKVEILQQVRRTFIAHRSLCEDIASLKIVPTQHCYLQGEIEILGTRPPAEIYADIFFQCARKISSNIRIERYEDALARGLTREDIFTGPLTPQGYVSDRDFEETRATPTIAELVSLVSRIEGVKQVHQLDLLNEKYHSIGEDFSCEVSDAGLPQLRFPERVGQLHLLKLSYKPPGQATMRVSTATENADTANKEAGIKQRMLLQSAALQLQKREFEYRAFRNNEQAVDQFISLPRGDARALHDYYSIQEQFPHIYGINRAGVPSSAKPDVKARAKQLKAYLFPFEQLMANHLATLQELGHLFSLDDKLDKTYFSQFLSNAQVPDIEELYASNGDATSVKASIAAIAARYDNYADRRSRVLDVMLAMYGEKFSQDALQRFNLYRQTNPSNWGIENKIHFLRHLTEVSTARGAAFDYQRADEGKVGSWHKRLSILLGISQFEQARSLCKLYREREIKLLSDTAYHKISQSRSLPPNDKTARRVPVLSDAHSGAQLSVAPKKCNVSHSMLRLGVHHDSYRMVERDAAGKGETVVYFQGHSDMPLYRLYAVPDRQAAKISVRQFRNGIIDINKESEGMHVVEHVLLRAGKSSDLPADFFAFQLSVIFPAWPARFADPEFRKLAQETICQQLPSHLWANVYWLSFSQMSVFENLQLKWLTALRGPIDQQRASASMLARFLQQYRSKDATLQWV